MIDFDSGLQSKIAQGNEQHGGSEKNFFFVFLPNVVVKTESSAFPDCRRHEVHRIWNRIREEISQKGWPGSRQETQAALYFVSVIICVDNIYGVLVIVPVAFLAILYRDVPTQAIVKDPRS